MRLDGLKDDPELEDFKNRLEISRAKLSVTHIQVDEKHLDELKNFQDKLRKVLGSLRKKGIHIQLEPTKEMVAGLVRVGLVKLGYDEMHKFDDELRKEIDKCEKARGKTKELLNIARDTNIAVSALGHDYFITTDYCLFVSWVNALKKHRVHLERFKIPKIIYAHRSTEAVARQILALVC